MNADLLVLGSALLSGLMGSAHCAAMCGGIATGFAVPSTRSGWIHALQPNLGRVLGYMLAGALAGGVGHGIVTLAAARPLAQGLRAAVGLGAGAGRTAPAGSQRTPCSLCAAGPLGDSAVRALLALRAARRQRHAAGTGRRGTGLAALWPQRHSAWPPGCRPVPCRAASPCWPSASAPCR